MMISSASASSSVVFQYTPQQFSGESFLPPSSNVRFRQEKQPSVISAAFASAATERSETTSTSTKNTYPYFPPKLAASFYEVLGIPIGATSEEIKSAYRRLARVCHPDVAMIDRKSSSADEFMRIHAAYSTLSDPDKRAEYDQKFLRQRYRYVGLYSNPRFTGYTGRSWETDQCW